MRAKAAFLVGGAVGYVLGTRAGREQFERIRGQAQRLWEDPRVQGTVNDVEVRPGSHLVVATGVRTLHVLGTMRLALTRP